MKVLGIDTGLANLGWCLVEMTDDGFDLIRAGTVQTKKTTKRIRASEDRVSRMQAQARYLRNEVPFEEVVAVVFEEQSWPRNSASCAMIGMSWGLCVMQCESMGLPVLQIPTGEIKVALTNKKTASKPMMEVALRVRTGFENISEFIDNLPKSRREHPVDACGAVIAAEHHDTLRALLRVSTPQVPAPTPEPPAAVLEPLKAPKRRAPPPPPVRKK